VKLLREGFLVGMVGAFALALWFLVVDLIAGHAFHTPAALGAGLFGGARGLGATDMPANAGILIVGYTIFHGVVFVAAGVLLAHVVAMLEQEPAIFLVAFFALFVFFEFSYFVYAIAFVQRVLEQISFPALLAGNVVAAAAMGGWLYRRHPRLHFKWELKLNA
jgi:hypothetical protein